MLPREEGGRRLQGGPPKSPPLVSILTVLFQARRDLEQLLESILPRMDANMEFIVVDGGSNDGTRELLREHDAHIDYWLSEPDHGVYDAMNKAIAAASGVFLLHLNAGDRLLSIPRRELEALAAGPTAAAAFRVLLDGRREFRPSYGAALRFHNTLHHQGTFFRRACFPQYDTSYRVFADFDVNQRLALRGSPVAIFDEVVASYTSGGLSSVASRENIDEFFAIIAKNYGRSHLPIAWLLCKWRGLFARLVRGRRQSG